MSILAIELFAFSLAFTAMQTVVFDRNVTAKAYDQIENGMTESEVIDLLMKPATPWPGAGGVIEIRQLTFQALDRDRHWQKRECQVWFGNGLAIIVYFDNDRRVKDKDIQRAICPHDRLMWEYRRQFLDVVRSFAESKP